MRLANRVVDLVRARVVEVFALEVNLCAAHFTAHAIGVINRRGATHKMREFAFELGQKLGIVLVARIRLAQFVDRVRQGFADKTAAVNAKVAAGVGLVVFVHQSNLIGVLRPRVLGGLWTLNGGKQTRAHHPHTSVVTAR